MHGGRQAVTLAIAISKLLPRFDLYTGLHVPNRCFSREHVVQKSVLLKAGLKHAVWDIDNLYCVDTTINSLRSNYKYVEGDPMEAYESMEGADSDLWLLSKGLPPLPEEHMPAVTCTRKSGQIVTVSVCYGGTFMIVDKAKRTVVPPLIARGAIARTVYKMYERYSGLYEYRHLVLEEEVMNRWLRHPKYHAEMEHDEFVKKIRKQRLQ